MDDLVETARARIAWRGAMAAAALNVVGCPLELLFSRDVPHLPHLPPLAAAGTGLILLAWLAWRRDRPTRTGAAAAFLINTAAIVAMLWVVNAHWATLGARWAPFQANKLGAITVGLLTPEIGVGALSILAYAGTAVAQWALFPPEIRAHLAAGEPIVTCIFAGFGAALLIVASRRFALERRLVQRQQQGESCEHLARVLLAVRDFANTPLQTIESATALAHLRHPDAARELELIERALVQLRRLNQLLSHQEDNVRWTADDTAFDAVERLANAARRHRPEH